MRKVFQDRFGKPDGNCLAACVASILELSLKDVDFKNDENWWDNLQEKVESLGYVAKYFTYDDKKENDKQKLFEEISQLSNKYNEYYIACGMGPRGLLHCVVMKGGLIEHDPFPSGGGIELPPEDYITLDIK